MPQFLDLGLPPNVTAATRNWGAAVGWDWVVGTSLVNTFRYGFTTIVYDRIGTLNAAQNYFRALDHLNEGYGTGGRETPTHNVVNDMTWLKGAHTVKFGTNLRFTRIPSYRNWLSYNSALANGFWVDGGGRSYIPGRGSCSTTGCSVLPAVASSFYSSWALAWIEILGVMSTASANVN